MSKPVFSVPFLPNRPRAFTRWTAVAGALLLGGCAVSPQPVTPDEVRERVTSDLSRMYVDQQPVNGPVTLEEAIARSLKYNLDYRLKKMESALSLGLVDTANRDMLPRLMASAGYRVRDNDSGGVSRGILDGDVSTRPTTSDERRHSLASAEFSWNALDFGVSYYRARQMSNQFLIAEERRRKVVQNIVQDVQTAYWRALGAQRLNARASEVLARASQAMARSREAEVQKLIPAVTALNYQRALLEATSQLNQRRQDLEVAKQELAALMNLPSGVRFDIADTAESALPAVPVDVARMEEQALLQRPELREEDFRKRITADEVRRQMLTVLPGISFDAGYQYDSNRLAYNDRWTQGGVRISWDLLRLAALPAMRKAQDAQAKTDEARRMALSMAVLTQLRVGVERYRLALEDYRLAEEASKVDQRLADYAKASVTARVDSELEAIRTQARAILGEYQRANAYSNAQIAHGRLYNTLGFDPLNDAALDASLDDLKLAVQEQFKANEKEAYRFTSNLFGHEVPRLALRLEGFDSEVLRVRVSADVKSVLQRQGLLIDPDSPNALTLRRSLRAANGDMSRSHWSVVLPQGAASEVPVLEHSALVPGGAKDAAEAVIAVAAVSRHLPAIRRWADQIQKP